LRLLRLIRLDAAAEQAGLETVLTVGGVRFTAVTLVGQILYWLLRALCQGRCLASIALCLRLNRTLSYLSNDGCSTLALPAPQTFWLLAHSCAFRSRLPWLPRLRWYKPNLPAVLSMLLEP
jgi:hypothetical protein